MKIADLNEVDKLIINIFREEDETLRDPAGFSREAIYAVKHCGFAVPCGNILEGLALTYKGRQRAMEIARDIDK